MPVKTFLNCTMPALVNIRVGSLRGTSGDDGTTVWPLRAKKSRKLALISLTPLIVRTLIHRARRRRKCGLASWLGLRLPARAALLKLAGQDPGLTAGPACT